MIQRLVYAWAAIALLGVIVLAVGLAILWRQGFGSRSEPSNMEASIAMKALDRSIPAKYEKMSSPLAQDKINIVEAGGHYQEHCATCHAENGSGDPKFHGIMSPRPTDLRSQETQEMSDGELYWVIKNGIRWSGMPAFGKPGDTDEHAWKMVAYVRHLPKVTPAEAQQVLHQSEEPMDHGAP
jgi:mono/diheme cytochrome c family protein